MNLSTHHSSQRRARAFTLVEILTAVAITTIIVFALVSMFNTSIKALQTANRQTDIWETARSTFGVLKQGIGEVTTGGSTNRINLFAANGPGFLLNGEPFRLQDIYLLSKDNNRWTANVFMLGRDRKSEPVDSPVRRLYRYQVTFTNLAPPEIEGPVSNSGHAYSTALNQLEKYLDDVAANRPTDGTINAMAEGIVHLRLVPYSPDGRTISTNAPGRVEIFDDGIIPPFLSKLQFSDDELPASVDLEMFVLEPDRIEEFRSQAGPIARRNYLDKHVNSVQLFRTRIPVRRELLARQ